MLIHNHNTPLGNIDPNTLSLDITTKVTMASKTTDGTKVTEVLVPMDAFRVKDTSFKFSAGDMACSAFAVLMANGRRLRLAPRFPAICPIGRSVSWVSARDPGRR